MTLAEMSSQITSTVGQTDAASVAYCKAAIKRRYQVLWDSFPWIDTQHFGSLSFTAGTDAMNLPGDIERIISVRLSNTQEWLQPVDITFLIETDASIVERTGTPTMYHEMTLANGSHQIRLFPKPAIDSHLFIVGKRVRPELLDATSPIIRNIDDALMAFASADMYERLRQFSKKNDKIQEGGALLESAKKLETEQGTRKRRAKPLTASGNALGDMADDVCARIGDYQPDTYILVKQFLRRNYQQLWDSHLWKESKVAAYVNSNGEFLIAPHYFDEILGMRADDDFGGLSNAELEYLFTVNAGVFEETTGVQTTFSFLTPVGVKTLPTGLEKLSIRSTSGGDTGTVYVMGESAGTEVSDTITLNGTAPVLTTNFYDVPLTITKPVGTAGSIVISGATSGTELQRLLSGESERKHIRIWITPPNTSGTECLVLGKRRITPLVNDQDTSMLRGSEVYLIEASTADAFSRFGKPNEAAEARKKADNARQILLNRQSSQGANQQRVVPSVEPSGYYGDALYGKAYF